MKTIPDNSDNLIFCSAKTQYENLGDLIINKTLIEKLRNYGKVIVNERGIPESFLNELNLNEEERASKYKLRFRLLVISLCLKSLFHPNQKVYYVLQPGHVYGFSTKFSALQIADFFYLSILKILGVHVCRFGISVGPFSSIGIFLERLLSKLISFYSVRESISEDYAKKIGIKNVQRFPDLAWLIEADANDKPTESEERDYVVFSFRSSTLSLDKSEDYITRLYSTLDSIVHLVYHKWSKKLVISYQVEGDYNLCKSIKDRYVSYDVLLIEERIRTRTMKNLYSRALIVFSNRLHVLLIAMFYNSLAVAVVDIRKHSKITGILSDAGLSDLIIDIDSLSEEKISVLNEMVCNPKLMKEHISLCFKNNRAVGNSILSKVMAGH